jgi:protocatechuate 3,4-dioxygenase beta subunit
MAGLFLSAAAIGMAQETNASVAGRVTDSATGEPVLHAHVSLYSQSSRQRYGALTGADGRFSIARLPPGRYSFSADAAGYQTPPIFPDRRTDLVALRPGDRKDDLDVALTPFGAISGRVLDAEGRPMQGVGVSVVGPDGLRESPMSDPDGQYRLDSLPPGRYRVRAVPRALNLPPEIRSDGTTEVHYVTTYYPASLTAESAAPLDVAPGLERKATDIRLLRGPIVAVRGTVTGIPASGPYAGISVSKVEPRRAPNTGRGAMGFGHRANPDGSFEIWGLDPGRYLFTAESNGAGWQSPPVDVFVADRDIGGVVLVAVRQFDISGQIVPDDERARVPRTPPNASLGQSPQISLLGRMGSGMAFAVVAADGSFHLTNVQAGQYSVRLSWGPYVKSMRLGSTDIAGALLDLRNGSGGAALTVTASSDAAQIAGVVRNGAAPVPYAQVALVSEETQTVAGGRSAGPDGTYTLTNVAPGNYQLLVLDAGVRISLEIPNPEDYADIAETVAVHPGDRITRDLRQHASGPR